MNLRLPAILPLVALSLATFAHAQNATTTPVGAVTVTIAAGTGVNKTRSLVSAPLLGSGPTVGLSSGRITEVTPNTITSTGAGWGVGGLSNIASPYIVRITSGAAEGRTFLISSQSPNTADTITIDAGDASFTNLTNLGIVVGASTGDTFQIHSCDTLSSFLGDPASTGVVGGATQATSDTVIISNTYGIAQTFYYSTTLGRWTRVALGNPDASTIPVRPDSGILYLRLGNTPINLTVTGDVPVTDRVALVKNSGVSYLASLWPVSQSLSSAGFQNLPGWVSSSAASSADLVTIGTLTYFYDGTNWRRVALGSPISNPNIEVGTCVMINRKGASLSMSPLFQNLPYSLN